MVGRRLLLGAASAVYISALFSPLTAAAQDTGALIGGIAGGMIGGMIAGSMARSRGAYYYRRSYAAPRATYRPRVAKARVAAPARGSAPVVVTSAASIDAGKDPFAKPSVPKTTSASFK